MKKALPFLLSCALAAGMAIPAQAAEFSDAKGHWAESAITRWSGHGVVSGHGDGSFAPNAAMTRSQLAQVLTNLLGLQEKADLTDFSDVDEDAWYADAMAKCVAAGIFNGTGDDTLSPHAAVDRQQMLVAFGRAIGLTPMDSTSSSLSDLDQVSGWAEGMINALLEAGYVSGMGDNTLRPLSQGNRASVMSLMDKSVAGYANQPGSTIEMNGESGVVLVASHDVTVTGTVGDLVISPGASQGSVTLKDATVTGTVTVDAPEAALSVTGNSAVERVVVSTVAQGAAVTVDKESAVGHLSAQAHQVVVSGEGKVDSAHVSGNDAQINTDGTKLEVSQEATGTTQNGSAVEGGSTVDTSRPAETPEEKPDGGTDGGSGSGGDDGGEVPNLPEDSEDSESGESGESGGEDAACPDGHRYVDGVCEEDGSIDPAAAQADSGETLLAALEEKAPLIVLTGSFTVEERITISYPAVLNGNGHTITAAGAWNDSSLGKHLMGAEGFSGGDVRLVNLTLDSAGIAYGLQPYDTGENKLILEQVTLRGSKGSGLTVNGSTVEAVGLTIENSGWSQSIDVSKGSHISHTARLTLDSAQGLKDLIQIAEDGAATAHVVVDGETWEATGYDAGSYTKYLYAPPQAELPAEEPDRRR